MPIVVSSTIQIGGQTSLDSVSSIELYFTHTENWFADIRISFESGRSASQFGFTGDSFQYTWPNPEIISSIRVANFNSENAPPGPGVWPTDPFSIDQICLKKF